MPTLSASHYNSIPRGDPTSCRMEKTEHNSSNLAKQEATGDENQFFSGLEKLAHHVSCQQKTNEDQLFTVVDQIIIRLRGTDHIVKNLTTSYQTQHNYQQDSVQRR